MLAAFPLADTAQDWNSIYEYNRRGSWNGGGGAGGGEGRTAMATVHSRCEF